jgi:hypothetical protein
MAVDASLPRCSPSTDFSGLLHRYDIKEPRTPAKEKKEMERKLEEF